MQINNERLLTRLKNFEALRLVPYKDATGSWTVGYGHLLLQDDKVTGLVQNPDRSWRGEISEQQASDMLVREVLHIIDAIQVLLRVSLPASCAESLVALAFNVGVGSIAKSDFLKNINATMGDAEMLREMAPQVLLFDHADGRVLVGLELRDILQAAWWLGW